MEFPENSVVSSAAPTPTGFYSQKLWGLTFLRPEVIRIYLSGAGTTGFVVWLGAGIAFSQGVPPNFYLSHVNGGSPILPIPPLCTGFSPAQLPVSTLPTCLDECGFF